MVGHWNFGFSFDFGDFWHCNPKKYPNGPIHKLQERKVEKDRELREYCDLHNIMLIEIWESDYKKDVEGVKNLLRNILLD